MAPSSDLDRSRACTLWVHANDDGADVLFNPQHLPTAKEGDVIHLHRDNGLAKANGLLFHVPPGGREHKRTLQVSVSDGIAQAFDLSNREQIILSKLPSPLPEEYLATHCEIYFKDCYVGRADLHRLTGQLVGTCAWVGQRLVLPGCSLKARLADLSVDNDKRRSAVITEKTQIVFRSHSAKYYIFLQVSSESWQFDTDGSLFFEKAVGLFLPELFSRWAARGTNHIACIVLFSRILYSDEELPEIIDGEKLAKDPQGRAYRDVYKVVCDFEPHHYWLSVLSQLKEDFASYQRDVLQDTHPRKDGRLAGRIAAAHEGNVLEAINLCISSFDKHYIDRDLERTGLSCIVVTAGTCQYIADQNLLRLTRERMRDHGISLEIVSLAKVPLHQVPVFQFEGYEPSGAEVPTSTESSASKPEPSGDIAAVRSLLHDKHLQSLDEAVASARSAPDVPVVNAPNKRLVRHLDPLYYDGVGDSADRTSFYYIPPDWVEASFYSRQPDRPFRIDRFMPRCVMAKVQSLGLVEYDNAAISIPPLASETRKDVGGGSSATMDAKLKRQLEREYFDVAANGGKARLLPSPLQSAKPSGSTVPSSMGSLSTDASAEEDVEATGRAESAAAPVKSRPGSPAPPSYVSHAPSLESRGRPPRTASPSRPIPATVNRSTSIASTSRSVSGATQPPRKSFTPALISRFAAQAKATPTIPTPQVELPTRPSWASFFRGTSVKTPSTSSALSTPKASEAAVSRETDYMSMPTASTSAVSTPKPVAKAKPTQPIAIRGRNNELPTPSNMNQLISASYSSSAAGATPPDVTFPIKPLLPSQESADSMPPSENATLKTMPKRSYANPSNPQEWAKRVSNVREPRPADHAVHWKSLCAPAVLPLAANWFPPPKELAKQYTEATYTLAFTADQQSVMLRPCLDDEEHGNRLLRELVYQRMQQNFQVVSGAMLQALGYAETVDGTRDPLRSADSLRGKTIYLTMASHIHALRYSSNSNEIEVSIFVRKQPWSKKDIAYRFQLWPRYGDRFEEVDVDFIYPTLDLFDWTRLDRVICGFEARMKSTLKFWRARFCLLPAPIPNKRHIIATLVDELDEASNDEEVRLAGMLKMFGIFDQARWDPASPVQIANPGVTYTFSDMLPSAFARDESAAQSGTQLTRTAHRGRSSMLASKVSLDEVATALKQSDGGLNFVDRRWQLRKYHDTFLGHELVDWLVSYYSDINTRQDAVKFGNKLQTQGLFRHVNTGGVTADEGRKLLDAYAFYVLEPAYAREQERSGGRGWFGRSDVRFTSVASRASSPDRTKDEDKAGEKRAASTQGDTAAAHDDKMRVLFTRSTVVDLDPEGQSERAETAWLHYDAHFSYNTAYHFHFEWVSTSRVIEEQVATITRLAERYGLRFVETIGGQITDASDKSPLEKPITIRWSVPPPVEWEGEAILALAAKFNYVLDLEPDYRFPENVDVRYTYRKDPTTGFQFMHTSGVTLIQVTPDRKSLLFLHNRLLIGHLPPGTKSGRPLPSVLLAELRSFCEDEHRLAAFWQSAVEDQVAKAAEMSRKAASEGMRTPQSGIIPPSYHF